MPTVHFVYPHGPSISCPDAIGRKVAERLRSYYDVTHYGFEETGEIKPRDGDILLGHPHPAPWTVFRRSARQAGWRRIIVMTPYNHDPGQVAFMDPVIARCDLFLAITGNFWFRSVQDSLFAHWKPKMVHVDLAVDRRDYPVLKREFNPPGSRRFLYVGHDGWQKNLGYLEQVAQLMAGSSFSWMGTGKTARRQGVTSLGYQDFTSEPARRLVAEHDFLITVGKVDANPTPILEAMSWGLVPVCTTTSGYVGHAGIVNIPVDDPAGAATILAGLQKTPAERLAEMQQQNWRALDEHFNWNRFTEQVLHAIRTHERPPTLPAGLPRKIRIRAAAWSSPNSVLRTRWHW